MHEKLLRELFLISALESISFFLAYDEYLSVLTNHIVCGK
jgi:hypothetical protein